MGKTTSLKDIADALGISKTTVSWVLSDQGERKGISKATQQRIRDYAAELDYKPNYLARSLNTGSTATIGLILPSISDSFYSGIAREIIMEAEKQGYTVMICNSESDGAREEQLIRMLKMKHTDGIIIAPTKQARGEIEKLVAEDYPFVVFDRYFEDLPTNYVIIDNENAGFDLTRRLLDAGRKKIAVITTNPHLTTMNLRRRGYERALRERGIEPDPRLYGCVGFEGYEENIFGVLDRIFTEVPDVDGFLFTTHILAIEAFRYFDSRGRSIERGAGWASFHSTSTFRVMAPEIKTAMMPIAEIGKNCVRILTGEIDAKRDALPRTGPVQLLLPCG